MHTMHNMGFQSVLCNNVSIKLYNRAAEFALLGVLE
jgi:hypothetical protein